MVSERQIFETSDCSIERNNYLSLFDCGRESHDWSKTAAHCSSLNSNNNHEIIEDMWMYN